MPSSLDPAFQIAQHGAPLRRRGLIRFLVPSLLGIALFLVPFQAGDSINIGMGLMADGLRTLPGDALPAIAVVVLCLSILLTLVAKLAQPGWAREGMLKELFNVAPRLPAA
ncbi:MAG: hypothetical protein RIC38_09685 [Chromatocurvus sp.]